MFDIGFSELLLVGVVALLVFGPEDLPRVARTVGHVLGKFRRYVSDVKSDISREMELADMKRLHDDLKEGARSFQDTFNEQARSLEADFQSTMTQVQVDLSPVAEPEALDAAVSEAPAAQAEIFALQPDQPAALAENLAPEPDESQLDLFGVPVTPARKD